MNNAMNHDDIIEEVRTIREQLAAKHNYDVRALFLDAKRRQQESDRRVVELAPRFLDSANRRRIS